MENDSSDANFLDKGNGIDLSGERQQPAMPENSPIKTPKGGQDKSSNAETTQNSGEIDEKVAEKVEGVTISESSIDTVDERGIKPLNTTDPEELVRDWESTYPLNWERGKKLSKTPREVALLTASLNLSENRGITVGDLVRLGYGKDYAEKLLQDGKRAGLLVPSEDRVGKQKQYCLSNYKHVMDKKAREGKRPEILPNDISLLLARELSKWDYVYHHIGLETILLHKDDYELFGGRILSEKNRQRVDSFRLDAKRNCSITMSPNGTVCISIECSIKPFELHTPSGLVDFFVSCGQILRYLQSSTINRLGVVPPVWEWFLTQFDYNKDLVIRELRDKNPVVDWAAKGLLKVKYLGAVFQIYSKHMPDLGECLRWDGHYSTRQKERVVETVAKITGKEKLPFTTAEELLSKIRENGNESDAL